MSNTIISSPELIRACNRSLWPVRVPLPADCQQGIKAWGDFVFMVLCDCYQCGRTSEPPIPREFISVRGGFPHLLVPVEGHEEIYMAFYNWLTDCCDHYSMRAFASGLGCSHDWHILLGDLELMHHIIDQAGSERVPWMNQFFKRVQSQ